jgi:hypothetical protein
MLGVFILVLLLGACEPRTYTVPVQIHITDGDQVKDAKIAIDASNRKHITGVVDDRVVYYRTRYGEPGLKLTLTMSGSGTDYKQSNPDIAVRDDGTAYITWVEQHGGPEKFACWRDFPLMPSIGGYKTYCNSLDTTYQTMGNVQVESNGNVVYVVYDRIDPVDGKIDVLFFRNLDTVYSYVVNDYIGLAESGTIYRMDLVVDSADKLHVALVDDDGLPPNDVPLLKYRSNVTVDGLGNMFQRWNIDNGLLGLDGELLSISLYTVSDVVRMAIATVWEWTGLDGIYIDSCAISGCTDQQTHRVDLPTSWDTFSVINDVELTGIGTYLYLSFIGNNDVMGSDQVWYKEALTAVDPINVSASVTLKYDLDMVKVAAQPNPAGILGFPVMTWAESNLFTIQYYVYDGLFNKTTVYDTDCTSSVPEGDAAANGNILAGVWDACSNTWFTTGAYFGSLPVIIK